MANHATHIRRIYGRRRQQGTAADPGKIATCVQVGVRPQTTGTLETMPDPLTECAARGTRLARIGRIDVLNHDTDRPCLVLDEGLQLPKGPAVQARADALASLDALADVGQVLQCDSGGTDPHCIPYDGLARFV